jgi:hypothetical protein
MNRVALADENEAFGFDCADVTVVEEEWKSCKQSPQRKGR